MPFLEEVIGDSPAILTVKQRLARLMARGSAGRRLPPVLLQGETGTGKGVVARFTGRARGATSRSSP